MVFHSYGWHYCHFLVYHGYGWHYIVISWCIMVTVGITLSFLSVSWLLLDSYCHFYSVWWWRMESYCHFLVFDGYGWHHIVISRCLMVTVGITLVTLENRIKMDSLSLQDGLRYSYYSKQSCNFWMFCLCEKH